MEGSLIGFKQIPMKGKLIALKLNEPLIPHTAQFSGKSAAVHTQVISKLLAVKRKGDLAIVLFLPKAGKICDDFFPYGSFGHKIDFLVQ